LQKKHNKYGKIHQSFYRLWFQKIFWESSKQRIEKIPQEFKEDIFMKVFKSSDTNFYTTEELNAYQSSLKTYTDYQNTIDTAFMEGEKKRHRN
jgi:hypothetical protein